MKKPIDKNYLVNTLKNFDTEVSEKKYLSKNDPALHTHENKTVLNKISESDKGTLLFDGKEIGNSSTEKPASAYDIAVKNGFSGTEEEWLESLKGAPGKDAGDISPEDIGAANIDHSHGYLKTITLSATEPTAVADGEIVMVYEE